MRKILFLAPSLTNDAIARPLLLARLFKEQHHTAIVGPAEPKKPILMNERDVSFERLSHQKLFKQILKANRISTQYDVIVACDGNLYASIVGLIARLRGKRFIFDTGDDHLVAKVYTFTEVNRRVFLKRFLIFKREINRRIAYGLRHFAHNRTVASPTLQKRFGGYVCSVPIDTNFYQHGDGTHIRNEYGSPIILHLGTIKRFKGFEYLIDAFPLIEKALPEAKLLVVGMLSGGPGGFAHNLKDEAEEMSNNILFLDAVKDNSETRDYLDAADCIVVTSEDNEVHDAQFPIKLGLAMAAKKPVVAWNFGIIPDVLGDGGILIEPTKEQISHAIISVFENKKRAKELAQKAFMRAEQLFSYNALRKPMEEIYFGKNEVTT